MRWLRDHPRHADVLLVVGLATLQLLALELNEGAGGTNATVGPGTALYVLAGTAPLAWRRTNPPVAVLGITAVGVVGGVAGLPTGVLAVGFLVAVYSIAAHGTRAMSLFGLGATAIAMPALVLLDPGDAAAAAYLTNGVMFGAAWILGDNLRTRRAYVDEVVARAAQLEREQQSAAREAVAQERARIARELHDVIAHTVSVMVVQAGAARRTVERDVEAAKDAMASIESTGRQALAEMRRLLGVLRADDEESLAKAPQPTIRHVDALVEQVREAGLAVDLVVEGEPEPLAAGLDLSAYRIVQEALTNVMKHAGPARATVTLRYRDDCLELVVADDGRGLAATQRGDGRGHGLVGMRERVALYGGELRTGPRPGGGYEISARLPFASERSS